MRQQRLATGQQNLEFQDELIVDNFAGGGGASTGIKKALGRPVDLAINHSPHAVAMHKANHPETEHYCGDVWDVDPRRATGGKPVGLAWFSPDCKHFSKAKGGKPVEKQIRGLAWVVIRWAATVRPRVIMLENVEEFQDWGPLTADNLPCKKRKGQTFNIWVNHLEKLGYEVDYRELKACEFGAPTSRKRFFLIARCDGRPIVWPEPTHGEGLLPFHTAAECIDFSIPCPSIFGRKKPLVKNTMMRIAKGIDKFVINDPDPFLISYYGPKSEDDFRGQDIDEPLKTLSTENRFGLVTPFITRIGQTGRPANPAKHLEDPLTTIVSKQEHILVAPHIIKHFSGVTGIRADNPFPTILSAGSQNQLVTSHLMTLRNNSVGRDMRAPVPTITAGGGHHAEVRAFLIKYFSAKEGQHQDLREPLHTIRTKDSFGLVMVHGDPYLLIDIGMRMLTPRELYNAQGFDPDYIIDPEYNGKPLTKTAQVKCCGNSVPPDLSYALVAANCTGSVSARSVA
jgi:DNA (cytosine-5)-methyltransferase 1